VGQGDTVTVDLGNDAAGALEELLGDDWFTIAVRFAQEGAGFEDTMELFDSGHTLYVTYTLRQ
jgi:hypothetical protein